MKSHQDNGTEQVQHEEIYEATVSLVSALAYIHTGVKGKTEYSCNLKSRHLQFGENSS